jgi:hypothetical protein
MHAYLQTFMKIQIKKENCSLKNSIYFFFVQSFCHNWQFKQFR